MRKSYMILLLIFTLFLTGCGEEEEDITAPTFSIGSITIFVPQGETQNVFEGITAEDDTDGDITASITADITSTSDLSVGDHTIIFTVTDEAGNTATLTGVLTIVDSDAPVIHIKDNNQTIYPMGSIEPNWKDFVTVTDANDNEFISFFLTVDTSTLNFSEMGEYQITYSYHDASNNDAIQKVITITVTKTWTDEQYFTRRSDGEGGIIITNYSGTGPKDVVIPEFLDGLPVQKIGTFAFCNYALTSVVIPDSVTTIQAGAFADNDLTSVNIPNHLWQIAEYTFRNNNLTTVVIPDYTSTIGIAAFMNNEITSLTLSSTLQSIEAQAFSLNNLTEVIIPNNVFDIGDYAFYNNNINTLTLPLALTHLGQYSFALNDLSGIITLRSTLQNFGLAAFYDSAITAYNISETNNNFDTIDGVLYNEAHSTIFAYPQSKSGTTYVVPDTVTAIEQFAFSNSLIETITLHEGLLYISDAAFLSSNLTNVTLPSTLLYIGGYAFSETFVTSIHLPGDIENIVPNAFQDTPLETITIDSTNLYYSVIDYVLFNKTMTEMLIYPSDNTNTTYIIPEGTEVIGNYILTGTNITNLTIASTVTYFHNGALSNNNFTSVTVLGDEFRFNDIWEQLGLPTNLKPTV